MATLSLEDWQLYKNLEMDLAYIEHQLREMYWNGGAIGSFASDVLREQFGVTP